MANSWTTEQLEAITQRGCNLLVAAAAGAGKTAVLVERIIRKITDKDKPVDIDRLLVVTFTNAAATEMRERIGGALANALEADPSSENLQKQMVLLDRASIMTLHAFCLEVVKSHFHSLDLDPVFRIADETESTLMKLEVLAELFEGKYENEAEESVFFQLVDSYGGGRDDSSLREIVLALHRFTRSHPWPEQWLEAQAEACNISDSACLSSTPWVRVLLKGAAAELQGLQDLLGKAAALAGRAQGLGPYLGVLETDMQELGRLLKLCRAAGRQPENANEGADGSAAVMEGLREAADTAAAEDSEEVADAAAAENSEKAADAASAVPEPVASSLSGPAAAACIPDWDEIQAAFSSFQAARLPRCGKDADTAVQEQVKAARTLMKDKVKKLCESGFGLTTEEITTDFRRLYPLFQYLSSMVCEFEAGYSQKKKEKGLLDFNDLEHYCLKVLLEDGLPTAAAKELRARFEEILVDEYQDSNLIQELILGTISGNQDGRYNIFMVGDVKQSIYRFRQARPELFLSKYGTYPHESGHDSRVIQLYKNFRSRPEVINGVNFIFKQIMSSTVGELDYTDEEALNPGAVFEEAEEGCKAGGSIEVHIIDASCSRAEILRSEDDTEAEGQPDRLGSAFNENADTGDENDEEPFDNIQAEARIIGKRIRNLVSHTAEGFNVYDRKLGAYRPAEYKDIVILMRATRSWADIFTDELAVMGIPAYADAGLGYFKTVEVETMLALLQIIDNPLQDIPMLAVLRSPIGGFSTDELADIRLADRSVSIFEAMKLFAGFHEEIGPEQAGAKAREQGEAEAGEREEVEDGEKTEAKAGERAEAENGEEAKTKAGEQAETGAGEETEAESGTETGAEGQGETEAGKEIEAEAEEQIAASSGTEEPGDARQKTRGFLQKLQAWRDLAQFTPTDELVWQLLTDTGYYSYAGVLPGGPERQANLRLLFERARQYEETSYKGLFNFVNFINKLRSGGGDMGSAKILGEHDNVVRIMSIHKSKGLEFPIVIVAGCGKRFNLRDLNAGILLHQELGYGPDLIDLEKRTISPTLSKLAIRQKLRLETLSEEMRILYVAFTRAKEKLIMTGCVRDVKKACSKWCAIGDTRDEKLPQYDMQQASTYLDWLGPALARHKSAEPLRQAAAPSGSPALVENDPSCWEVMLWGIGAAALEKEAAAAEENIRKWLEADKGPDAGGADAGKPAVIGPDTPQYSGEQLIRKLEWQYPFRMLAGMPAKLSVTELKRRFASEEQLESASPFIQPMAARPLFMEPEKGLSAARKGTVMHFVMQHMNLAKLAGILNAGETAPTDGGLSGVNGVDEAAWTNVSRAAANGLSREIGRQLAAMVDNEQLTAAEAETVNVAAISKFFGTTLGKSMLSSTSLRRETAFNIEIKCAEIYKELPREESGSEVMLLQGVIDCWFETEAGLVLLDYKTDYVPDGGAHVIMERYRVQLDYYTRALEIITGKKVVERYLYLFHSGELLRRE